MQARVGSEGGLFAEEEQGFTLVIPSLPRILRDSAPGKKESEQL